MNAYLKTDLHKKNPAAVQLKKYIRNLFYPKNPLNTNTVTTY